MSSLKYSETIFLTICISRTEKKYEFFGHSGSSTLSTLENLSGRSGFSKFILQTFFPEDSSIEPC